MARTTRGKSGSGTRRSTASTRRTPAKKTGTSAGDDSLTSVEDSIAGADTTAADTIATVEDTYGAETPDTIAGDATPDTLAADDTTKADADSLSTGDADRLGDDTSASDTVADEDTASAEADTIAAESTSVEDTYGMGSDELSAKGSSQDTIGAGSDTIAGSDSLSGADTRPEEPVSGLEDDTLDRSASAPSGADDTAGDATLAGEGRDVAAGSEDDTVAAAPTATATPQPVEKTVERRGGFVPMLLGGAIAAGLGFVAGTYAGFGGDDGEDPFVAETQAALQTQGDRISELDSGLAALDARLAQTEATVADIDTAPLSTAITGLEEGAAAGQAGLTDLGTALTALDERLTALEKAPVVESVSPEAIAAYERELDTLRSEIAAQSAAIAAEREEIETLAREAMEAEAQADAKAILAESRAALAELTARAQDGRPFTDPLTTLRENAVEVPDALVATAETGVPTVTALADSFPDPAREALRVARAGEEGQSGNLGSFLRSQLGARSVVPREGDDPDAVLSRAEAAVKAGDIATALSELEALPPEAQAELAEWTEQAALRRDALDAASAMGEELNNEQGSE